MTSEDEVSPTKRRRRRRRRKDGLRAIPKDCLEWLTGHPRGGGGLHATLDPFGWPCLIADHPLGQGVAYEPPPYLVGSGSRVTPEVASKPLATFRSSLRATPTFGVPVSHPHGPGVAYKLPPPPKDTNW
jgi:hypothetical protein